ncbi:YafY family transcriptional regulator [Paenibacillus sp. TRM 82003]|nr:YafY family transcriptional regulator [Paenibacillus sp. TRM 82003]
MPKADHMLSILWLLKTRRRMTAKQLAEELEIHIRSVYRYIDALCASGVPVVAESGPNGGYTLLPTFRESPLFFDMEEQKALTHAAVFAQEAGYPYGKALERAVAKLKRYANEEQQATLERHAAGFEVIVGPADGSLEPVLQAVEQAVAERRTMRIEYERGFAGMVQERTVEPYGLLHWKNRWYTVAYCRLREDIRSFRVDRIRGWESGDAGAFERPDGFSARRYFLKFLLPDVRDGEGLVDVRLRGTSRSIDDLSAHWLFGHALIERTADTAAFRLEASSVEHFVPYTLLSYGASVEVLEPASLVRTMLDLLTRLQGHYGKQREALNAKIGSEDEAL